MFLTLNTICIRVNWIFCKLCLIPLGRPHSAPVRRILTIPSRTTIRRRTDAIWEHFTRNRLKNTVECRLCKLSFECPSSTGDADRYFGRHLEKSHLAVFLVLQRKTGATEFVPPLQRRRCAFDDDWYRESFFKDGDVWKKLKSTVNA